MISLGSAVGRHARPYCGECEARIGDVFYRPRHLRGPLGTLLVSVLKGVRR